MRFLSDKVGHCLLPLHFSGSASQRPSLPCISREYPMRKRLLAVLPCLALALLANCTAAQAQTDPASLPARDAHQGLLVTVDPYLSADRYKEKFGKHTPYEAGVAAIEVYFKNDTAAPLKIDLDTIRLLIAAPGEPKQKIESLAPDYVADLVLLNGESDIAVTARRLPLPLPGGVPKSGKGKEWDEFASELRSLALSSDVLRPQRHVPRIPLLRCRPQICMAHRSAPPDPRRFLHARSQSPFLL